MLQAGEFLRRLVQQLLKDREKITALREKMIAEFEKIKAGF